MADEGCDDDEWEEKESLILVELVGVIDFDEITSSDINKCNVLGLDTERPLLQLDRCLFMGEYKEAVGTIMLFEESQGLLVPGNRNQESEAQSKLKYTGKTFKKLLMKRAFLSDKSEANLESQSSQDLGANMEEAAFQIENDAQETFVEKAGESLNSLSEKFIHTSLTDSPLVESNEDIVKKPKMEGPNKEPP